MKTSFAQKQSIVTTPSVNHEVSPMYVRFPSEAREKLF